MVINWKSFYFILSFTSRKFLILEKIPLPILTDLYVLEGSEEDLTVFRNYLSVNLDVYDKNCVGSLSQEL